ncbi:SGNH/GDSL hydrolase family protein [Pseudomonas multiresinivorans]|uniref:SGNH/GDSL hydrolase family protein n=1 Tax=Pseudomonas multiresinivorans TaxID=95301 RepID=A0A7Z3GQI0_9PSED|nr:SGNH/GDSL hydrolase family protein [Pseudomonas multiresinivorans]QJP09048.1 SGNH/GDSL hydrolase family protein [Pseudomonas multiresinivorans]
MGIQPDHQRWAALTIHLLTACLLCVLSNLAISQERIIIVEMYGDSTTLGAQTINQKLTTTPNNEPNALQDLLQSEFGKSVLVVNNGVGGTQAYQLLSGTDGRNRPWAEQMAKSPADIVIFNYGLNDQSYNANPTPDMYQETPESYAMIIGWLIQTARNNGKLVVLQEPNPTCYQPTIGNLARFVTALRGSATNMNAPLVPFYDYIQTLPHWKDLYSDCVHPSDQLYGIKAKQTYTRVAPLVRTIVNR